MKLTILLVILGAVLAQGFKRVAPPASTSSESSDEELIRPLPDHRKRVNPRPRDEFMGMNNNKKPIVVDQQVDSFFERPSQEDMTAYDRKMQKQMNQPSNSEATNDDTMIFAAIGQLYLSELSNGELDDEPEAGNVHKNNNNVNVKVNNVKVRNTLVGIGAKPEQHEPAYISQTKQVYLNFNTADMAICVILFMALIFGFVKLYKKCFVKKNKIVTGPQLPVTMPPNYSVQDAKKTVQ